MAELFEDGELLRHLNRSRRIYRARRDFLLQLLDRKLGGVLQPHTPRGGMALWAAVAPELGLSSWSERARARGLSFRTGGIFSFRPRERPFVRLGFARFDEAQLEEAVARMVKALPVRATRARGRRP